MEYVIGIILIVVAIAVLFVKSTKQAEYHHREITRNGMCTASPQKQKPPEPEASKYRPYK
jgi:hypothetical protein